MKVSMDISLFWSNSGVCETEEAMDIRRRGERLGPLGCGGGLERVERVGEAVLAMGCGIALSVGGSLFDL